MGRARKILSSIPGFFLKHPDSKTGFTGIILVGDAYVNEPNVE